MALHSRVQFERACEGSRKEGLMTMTARDVFALVVRLAGMGFVVFGILDAIGAAATISGIPTGHGPNYPVQTMALAMVMYFTVGLLLLVAAKPITHLVYGREK
jgi:hypothetical protein